MTQFGFYFNQEDCIGCKVCQVVCCDRNDLAPGITFRRVESYETGSYPDATLYHYSLTCNHCASPACVANCPSGAMQKDPDDGTVFIDYAECIGCGTCVKSCPYGVPVLQEDKGTSGKCDGCKPFRDAGQNPVCVDACVMRAIEWGDIEELRAKHGDAVSDLPILPSSSETNPSLLVTPKEAALNEQFKPVIV